jgi:hypothetical protein
MPPADVRCARLAGVAQEVEESIAKIMNEAIQKAQ